MSAAFRAARTDFDRIYRRHVASVYRYAYAVLGNHADAEDVTQQTFLNAYRAISEGTKPRKAENWLLTIAHNELRRHFRRAHGKPLEVVLDEELADVPAEHADPSVADVVRALQHLPPIQRSALVMREFEGRSYAEIAEVLNVTQSALETVIFRARRALAESLEGALTCADAEQALSRRLDGHLPRREARRLKAHLRECPLCVRYADVQKRQSSLLKGFSVMPIPASLFLFRGEQAAAAGLGVSAAAAGGSTTVAGGGLTGLATAFAVKAAAVTATVGVAGGVGYAVTKPDAVAKPESKTAQVAAVADERESRAIALAVATKRRGGKPQSMPTRPAAFGRKAHKPKVSAKPTRRAKAFTRAEKRPPGRLLARPKSPPLVRVHPATPAAAKAKRTRPAKVGRPEVGKRTARPESARPPRAAEKPPREPDPDPTPSPNPGGRAAKS